MLKELAEKIEELVNGQVEPELETINGVDYIKTAKGYEQLKKPRMDIINVNSLNGLVEMVKVVIKNEVLGIPALVVNVDVNDIIVSTSHNMREKWTKLLKHIH